MASSTKRKTRVAQVVVVILLLGGGVAGAYFLKQKQLDADALAARDAGRAALAAGDYVAALDGLGRYLQRAANRDSTSDDYVQYARARRHVELPNGKHMIQAIFNLRRALEKDPSNLEARQELLDGYLRTGYATEALSLIEDLLAANPGDLKLLGVKADVLEAQRRFADALKVARQITAATPDDIGASYRELRLLVESQALPSDVDKCVAAAIAAHAADPRWELLRAAALTRRGDADAANRVLDAILAAPRTGWDTSFIVLLVGELDAAGRPPQALQVLETLPDTADAELQRELLRRLWYAKRLDDLVARVSAATNAPRRDDAELVALHATALIALGRPAEAEPMRTDLAGRGDAVGKAWSAYVEFALAVTQESIADSVPKLTSAVAAVPASAFLRQALGDAHAAVGEADLAIQDWAEAGLRAPSWSRPLVATASVLMRTPGREFLAPGVAGTALKRCPDDLDAVRVWVESIVAAPGELTPAMRSGLLDIVAKVNRAAPSVGTDLLPVELGILAATDKSEAETRLLAILDARAPTSESTLLRLAQIAEQAGIPLGSRFLDVSERVHGVTPQLALARALLRARDADAAAGLRVLDEMQSRAGTAANALDWSLVRASYLDAVGDPGAGRAWIELADAHPDELQAQLGALASASAWASRDAMERIVSRIENLSQGRGITWRIARARLILNTPDAPGSKIAEAATLLSGTVKMAPSSSAARLLLAEAFEKLGNVAGAQEQLRVAAEMTPGNAWIALELARIAMAQGQLDVARSQIDRALSLGTMGPDQIERAAYLLAVQGDRRRSTGLLEPLTLRKGMTRDAALLLARLYAQLGETDRAIDVCTRLLPAQDADAIELMAGLYRSTGRTADADASLARLDGASLRPGDRELVRARHTARWGSRDAAKALFRKAVESAPERADAWIALVRFAIAAGDMDLLRFALADPRTKDVESIQFVAELGEACADVLKDERLQGTLLAAMNDKTNRTVLVRAVRVGSESVADRGRLPTVARSLRELADSNAKVLPLQLIAAAWSADAGDPRAGCEIAMRASADFPSSAAAAQMSAELLARTGRWNEALEAGLTWGNRASPQDLAAGAFVAEARLRTGHPVEAADGLEPNLPQALARPDDNQRLILLYAVALTRSARSEKAAAMLRKLVERSPNWRSIAAACNPAWLGDAAGATSWLTTCAALIPDEDVASRVVLGRAWGGAWEIYRTPELLAEARRVLGSLAASPNPPVDVLVTAATIDQGAGELEAARNGYVAALARDPARIDARNNLAVVLADLGQWQQAEEEATKVVQAAPRVAECFETLSYAQRKGKAFDRARANLSVAIKLEPANPKWAVILAETLAEAGEKDELTRQLSRIENAFPGSALPAPLRERVERLGASHK